MRRKVNIKIPESDLDYGKKPYASPTAYQGQVRKASSKLEHDQVIRQYSEFKRPQGNHDSYQDMEYWADPPPGFIFPDFTVPDWPGMEYPVPHFEPGAGEHFVCACMQDGCYCPGQTVCFDAGCTYPVVGAYILHGDGKFSISSGGKNRICITAAEDAVFSASVFLRLQKLKPNGKGGVTLYGTCDVGKLYGKCRESECCAGTEDMAWDYETSSAEIAQESSCVVAITDAGDGSPYTWSVSGTGFYFNAARTITSLKTSAKAILLYTDATACGMAEITVTACDENEVAGEVMCTAGDWYACSPAILPYPQDSYSTGSDPVRMGNRSCVYRGYKAVWPFDYGAFLSSSEEGSSCTQETNCNGVLMTAAAILSGDPTCNYGGDFCVGLSGHPENGRLEFYYWGCS